MKVKYLVLSKLILKFSSYPDLFSPNHLLLAAGIIPEIEKNLKPNGSLVKVIIMIFFRCLKSFTPIKFGIDENRVPCDQCGILYILFGNYSIVVLSN